MEQSQKDALKVQVLTGRISQLVAQYEDQNADLQAQAQLLIDELNEKNSELQTRVSELEARLAPVEENEAAADDEG